MALSMIVSGFAAITLLPALIIIGHKNAMKKQKLVLS
jgi:predicted RND superfamily exporter protein